MRAAVLQRGGSRRAGRSPLTCAKGVASAIGGGELLRSRPPRPASGGSEPRRWTKPSSEELRQAQLIVQLRRPATADVMHRAVADKQPQRHERLLPDQRL